MWARYAIILVGIWLMAAPGIFDFEKFIADNDRIVGPIVVTIAVISISESTRNIRFANLLPGAWLLFAPWVLDYDNSIAFASDYVAGLLILGLALVKLKRKYSFGGGWSVLFK